jgi:hypothetical protein
MADPFTDVHAAIWTTLEASSAFTTLVPAANRLKLDGQVSGQMDNDAKGAYHPVVRVVPTGGEFDAHVDSSSSALTQVWNIEMRYGDERTDEKLYPLMWAVLRAMAAAFPLAGTIRSLTWNSKTYVRACRLTRDEQDWGTDYVDGDDSNVRRWRCVWRLEVLMHFATADLAPS